jgi:hypothetical protein
MQVENEQMIAIDEKGEPGFLFHHDQHFGPEILSLSIVGFSISFVLDGSWLGHILNCSNIIFSVYLEARDIIWTFEFLYVVQNIQSPE